MPRARARALADLLGARKDPAFERLAGLAAKLLDAPMAMVTLVERPHLHPLGASARPTSPSPGARPQGHVLPAHGGRGRDAGRRRRPRARADQGPRGRQVRQGARLRRRAADARPASVVGTLCVADSRPRAWKREEIALLEDLALVRRAELETRAEPRGAAARASETAPSASPTTACAAADGQPAARPSTRSTLKSPTCCSPILAAEAGTGAIGVPERRSASCTRSTTRRPGWR